MLPNESVELPFAQLPLDQNSRYNGDGDVFAWQREGYPKQAAGMPFHLQPLATTANCYSQQPLQQQQPHQQGQHQSEVQSSQESVNFEENVFAYQQEVRKE